MSVISVAAEPAQALDSISFLGDEWRLLGKGNAVKKLSLFVLSVVALVGVAHAAIMPVDKVWEETSNDDGITVYRKEVPGSDLVAFRGETTIDAPIAKVANVLIDTSRKLEWVHKIVEAKDVRPIGEYERVEYNHTASGFFLVRDRDFVFQAKATIDKPNQRMTLRLKSVDDPLQPETDCVRGHLDNSAYTMTAVDGGKKTHLVVEIHADPRGAVPKWLVNLFQKAWPRNTIEGIKRQVAKPDVLEHPGVKAAFADSAPAKKSS